MPYISYLTRYPLAIGQQNDPAKKCKRFIDRVIADFGEPPSGHSLKLKIETRDGQKVYNIVLAREVLTCTGEAYLEDIREMFWEPNTYRPAVPETKEDAIKCFTKFFDLCLEGIIKQGDSDATERAINFIKGAKEQINFFDQVPYDKVALKKAVQNFKGFDNTFLFCSDSMVLKEVDFERVKNTHIILGTQLIGDYLLITGNDEGG